MTTVNREMWVSEIVKDIPKSADIFRKNRIDYCCGGKMPISQAVEERGLDLEGMIEEINSIEQHEEAGIQPKYLDEKGIVKFIQNRYHQELMDEFAALTPYVTKLARKHGPNEPHLVRIQELYKTLKHEMIEHTEDEDHNVFPLIIEFMENPTPELAEKVRPHVSELEGEHEAVGDILKEIRDITSDFTPHDNACGTYRLVYARLEKLEKDTFDHVHLENHELFERVRKAI